MVLQYAAALVTAGLGPASYVLPMLLLLRYFGRDTGSQILATVWLLTTVRPQWGAGNRRSPSTSAASDFPVLHHAQGADIRDLRLPDPDARASGAAPSTG